MANIISNPQAVLNSIETGTCGFCGRNGFKLSNGGRLSRHGFRRPGSEHSEFSSFSGCPGSGLACVEISDTTLRLLKAFQERTLQHAEASLPKYELDGSENGATVINYHKPANGWESAGIDSADHKAQREWRRAASSYLRITKVYPVSIQGTDLVISKHPANAMPKGEVTTVCAGAGEHTVLLDGAEAGSISYDRKARHWTCTLVAGQFSSMKKVLAALRNE